MTEREKYGRRGDPLYAKLKSSPGFIKSVMSEEGLNPAASPEDPIEAVMPEAASRAEIRQRPLAERKLASLEQRREARTAAGKAAHSLLSEQDESSEVSAESEQTRAQAQALVSQMTPEELAAVEEAMIQRAAKAAQEAMSEGEREAAALYQAEQAAAARVTADLGFNPNEPPAGEVWNDADIEETGLEWRDELDEGDEV